MGSLLIIVGIGVLSLVTVALLRRRALKAEGGLMCRPPDFPETRSGRGIGTSPGRRYKTDRGMQAISHSVGVFLRRIQTWLANASRYRCRVAQTLIALTLLGATQAFARP